jgi:hypothetical protein
MHYLETEMVCADSMFIDETVSLIELVVTLKLHRAQALGRRIIKNRTFKINFI